MKQLKRETAIETLVNDMTASMMEGGSKFCAGIAEHGLKGFANMTNEELEEAYATAMSEQVKIIG